MIERYRQHGSDKAHNLPFFHLKRLTPFHTAYPDTMPFKISHYFNIFMKFFIQFPDMPDSFEMVSMASV